MNSHKEVTTLNSIDVPNAEQLSSDLATLLADGVEADFADFKQFWIDWFNGKFGSQIYTQVYYQNNIPAGVVRLWNRDDIWLIEGLYVPTAFRRQGIAEKLLAQAIQVAKENKFDKLFSNIKNTNTASINLHTKLGFTLLEKGTKDSFGNYEDSLNKYVLDLSL